MPRLPGPEALGGVPSTRSGRTTPNVGNLNTGGSGLNKGIAAVGTALMGIAEERSKEDDALDVLKAEAHRRTKITDLENSFDRDNDDATFNERFTPAAKAIDDEAAGLIRNEKTREKWRYRADIETEGSRNRVLDKGTRLAKEKKYVETDDAITKLVPGPGDPEEVRSKRLQEADDAITLAERSGLVSPLHANKMRKDRLYGTGGAIYREAESRLDTDPYGVLADLNVAGKRTPTTADPSDLSDVEDISGKARLRSAPRKGAVEGIVIHHTAGSSLDGALSHGKIAGTGTTYYVDRDGSIKRAAADEHRTIHIQEPGSPRRTGGPAHLGNDNTIGIEVVAKNDADVTDAQRAALERLLGGLSSRHKIKPDNIVGHGELQGGPGGNKEADEGVAAAKAFRSRPRPELITGSIDPNDVEPEIVAPEVSAAAQRYMRMTPEARAALTTRARTALSAVTQQEIADDIERIRRTGQPQVGEDGRTSLDRAGRVLTRNQVTKMKIAWDEAALEHKAVSPLRELSEDQAIEHLARLTPDEKAPEDSYRSSSRVQKKAIDEWKRVEKLRNEDPGGSVSGAPELKAAAEATTRRRPEVSLQVSPDGEIEVATAQGAEMSGQKARAAIIEARLAAQERIGLPNWKRKTITKREAERLMDMPADTTLPDDQFTKRLRVAADRVDQAYGKELGRKVFEDAVALTIKGKEHREEAASIISRMARGERVSNADLRRFESLGDIDRVGRAFEGQSEFTPGLGQPERPAISPNIGTLAGIGDYASQEASKKPNAKQKEWLTANPDQWQVFDQEFGRGASSAILKKGEKKKP